MAGTIENHVSAGNEAARKGDWAAAVESFAAAVEEQPVAEALFGLSNALWWLGKLEDAIDYRQRAYVAFRDQPDPAQVALCALLLCFDFRKQIGNRAVAAGWFDRAARLVNEHGIDELQGWLQFARCFDNEDPVAGVYNAYFEARDAADLDGDGGFNAILTFDTVHDLPAPTDTLRAQV